MHSEYKLTLLGIILFGVIFAFDLITPLGVASGVLYIILVLLAYSSLSPKKIIYAGIIGSFLTALGYFLSPSGGEFWKIFFNRSLSLLVIWTTVFFCLKTKHSEDIIQKFKMAVEQSPVSIVITNIDGIIEYVNPMFTAVTQYTKEEAVGKNPRILKSEKHPPEFYEQLWNTILSGNKWKGELCNKTKDGTLFWESTAIAPIKTNQNKITHFVTVKEDITQRKQLESKLLQLSFAVEQSLNSIMITDTEGKIEYINTAFTKNTGYEFDEAIGKTPRILKSGKQSAGFYKTLWDTLLAGKTWEGQICNKKKNGALFWEYTCISPIKDATGQTTHFLAVKLDDTQRKLDKEKLQAYAERMAQSKDELEKQVKERTLTLEEEKRTSVLIKTIAEIANYETTFDLAIEKSLNVFCTYLGWEVGHAYFVGKNENLLVSTKLWYLKDPQKFSNFKKITEKTDFKIGIGLPGRVAETKKMNWIEDLHQDRNFPRARGKNIHIVTGMAFPIILQNELVGVLEFFSQNKQSHQSELESITISIGNLLGQIFGRLRLNKMKTEFVSTAAHELRTPLTSIQGYSELLMLRSDISEETQKEFLGYINKEALALTDIINDLLDISRIESQESFTLNKKRFTVKEIFEENLKVFQRHSDSHKMLLKIEDPSMEWFVDKEKINQILNNIYSNAIKYSPDGGDIETTIKDCSDRISVSIKDHGIGMNPEHLGNFFEKYYRADASNTAIEGTGLGTTIMKALVEAHGGDIQVQSDIGKGTEITFSIPKVSST
jgi:two-component system, sensor histidine kinase and response regulator